ncbi:MAG: hypothetical protein JO250_12430 [Armatimonadetes bacterium]|nr:hypothetical protein [Armatimonadota bacterium]
MDTVILSIEVSDPALLPEGDLSGLLGALADKGAMLDILAGVMTDWERQNYASEGATFGAPWAALSGRTVAEKARRGYSVRTLIQSGAMQAGAGQASAFGDDTVTTGWDLAATPYVPYQQADVGNKPGRIVAAVVAGEVQEMQDRLQQYLDDAGGGGATGITITATMI